MIGISAAVAGFLGLGLIGGLIEATGGADGTGSSSPAPAAPSDDGGDGPAKSHEKSRQEPQGERAEPEPQQSDGRRSGDGGHQDEGHERTRARATVQRIVDGDTLLVSGDGSVLPKRRSVEVRLLEVDTPEAGKCFADKATARTGALLPVGSTVRVERDEDLKDRYGRYLLYVWNGQGTFVNLSLVEDGFAKAVLYQPNDKYWQQVSGAGTDAKASAVGLWAGCDKNPPPRERQRVEPDKPDRPGLDTPQPNTPERDPRRPEPAPEPARPEPPSQPVGPPAGGPDLDCSDLPGPTPVGPNDPHRLDADGDGIGCD